jgi:prepilin-type N-terminal cleavage/methylation domain-containing protein
MKNETSADNRDVSRHITLIQPPIRELLNMQAYFQYPPRNQQQGFTLIEIAIVLVIIGLLLGGVLKGQELIENGKVKNAIADLNGVSAAYNAYRDRYKALPGDDGPAAKLTGRGWPTSIPAGNSDGIVTSTAAQTFTGAGEVGPFFQMLKQAGFITGDPTQTGINALPQNAFGGRTGVTSAAALGWPAGLKVCMANVPGKAAITIDNQLDDGNPASGSVRSFLQAGAGPTAPGAAAATALNESQNYTVCRQM